MDTRLLRYFLAIAQEGNMTRAAQILHVTQPTLSKQINKLEEIVDAELFIRSSRQMTLTEAGLQLRDRAKEIVELTDKTIADLRQDKQEMNGKVIFGCAETQGFRQLIKTFSRLKATHPKITYEINSGNAIDMLARLDKGLLDFVLVVGSPNLEKYHTLQLNYTDQWGILLRKDDPLNKYHSITPEILRDLPLIVSQQAYSANELSGWLGDDFENCDVVASYNLINNAALMAAEGFGYVMTLANIVNTTGDSDVAFLPLKPNLPANLYLVWKKNAYLSPAAELYLKTFREMVG
ncbi:LysR family transcriptional regulator [Fundicoccus culcitae]|uniref:LysR family transcriptional regulator n=1 Tax=Fundicoccus culcitae TaxID=2969821 RepID=A0ABY5P8J6_9LACT|nr:LysR family transcriptional regulator [Fundicoccus culcitae]UUX35072.1 LysR family transcriptional regulator [Fundicoccus culcitae]